MERMCKSLKALDAELDDIQLPKLGDIEIHTDSYEPQDEKDSAGKQEPEPEGASDNTAQSSKPPTEKS